MPGCAGPVSQHRAPAPMRRPSATGGWAGVPQRPVAGPAESGSGLGGEWGGMRRRLRNRELDQLSHVENGMDASPRVTVGGG